MTVRVVTDSTSDIPAEMAASLGITVVPCNIHFGTELFQDGVDLSKEEFYERLIGGPVHPTTSQPSPGAFVDVFDSLGGDADGIVSIHVSAKLSGTCNSAVQAKSMTSAECPIEVVDSRQASMGLGVIAVAAAEVANSGAGMEEVLAEARSTVERAELIFLLGTLEYLQKGGRIGKARAMLGTVLKIKPMIILRDGVVDQLGRVRSAAKGADKLLEVARGFAPLESASALHTTGPEAANRIADSLKELLPEGKEPIVARAGTTIGVYAGPGALGIAVLRAKDGSGSGA